jgi:hypothetical protein
MEVEPTAKTIVSPHEYRSQLNNVQHINQSLWQTAGESLSLLWYIYTPSREL